ncbi:MAG: hypothetical protein AAF098_19785 [Pseudomonadota bacterium]
MRLAIVALSIGYLAISPSGLQAQVELVVGVRGETMPFSSLVTPDLEGRLTEDSKPNADGLVYSGYMASLCASVISEMRKSFDFSVRWQEVEAVHRFSELSSGNINILCDPATITRARLEVDTVLVSPPVYLSGVGRAYYDGRLWPGHWPCVGPLVGVVRGTTATRSVISIAEQFGFDETFTPIVSAYPIVDEVTLTVEDRAKIERCFSAMQDSEDVDIGLLAEYADPNNIQPDRALVVRSYANHQEMARALCSGEIYFSVGDLEIIASAISSVQSQGFNCPVKIDPEVFSEERYGVFVSISDGFNEVDRLTLAFLRQLSIEIHKGSDSILVRSFVDFFDRDRISQSLDLFYWSLVSGSD